MTIYGRKPRKIRCIAAATIIILVIAVLCVSLSANADTNNPADSIQIVTVHAGDSLWSLVKKYCNYSGDIRKAVYEVEKLNQIENAAIYPGEMIYIPEEL